MIKPIYISRPLLNAALFQSYAAALGFKDVVPDMHVTLAYSRVPVPWNWEVFMPQEGDMTVSGPERNLARFDGGAVVLEFSSQRLDHRWSRLVANGASWDHPTFRSHITLAYDVPEHIDVSELPVIRTNIHLGGEQREELDIDYSHG